jgi:aminoglycoside phosphotransferase (APT) family kinase protein
MYPWSTSIHDLLRFIELTEFPAPHVVGVDGDVEVLTWIDGESGAAGWEKIVPEDGLCEWGRTLRRLHDAIATYRPRHDSLWSSGPGTCETGEIICHGDFGPWNAVWQGSEFVGLLDWDHARPASPMFDVAYALEYAAPFRDDGECVTSLSYPQPPDRRRRIEIFCDAYGIAAPSNVAQLVAEQQRTVLETCESLARRGIEPQAGWFRSGHGEELQARIEWTEASGL